MLTTMLTSVSIFLPITFLQKIIRTKPIIGATYFRLTVNNFGLTFGFSV